MNSPHSPGWGEGSILSEASTRISKIGSAARKRGSFVGTHADINGQPAQQIEEYVGTASRERGSQMD
jgi:hypothetical protein